MYQEFENQDKCYRHLEKIRWGSQPECPYCNSHNACKRKNENRYKCLDCNRSYSVLVGTIMEGTKLPLIKWFIAMCLILNAKKGISSLQLSRDIGVNKNTAWYLQKRLRNAMKEDDVILKGIVEADESYIGGSEENKHYYTKKKDGAPKRGTANKTPVLGMVERKGKIIVKVITRTWGKEIQPILKEKIDKSSEVVTDGFGGYYNIGQYFSKHEVLNHSKFIRKKGQYYTNTIEGFWSLLKRAIIGQYHKISPEYLQGYLNEITFKYNHRNDVDAFNILLINSLNTSNANS
jgi:transposase-like protein